jgi:uncharacterized membrane protein
MLPKYLLASLGIAALVTAALPAEFYMTQGNAPLLNDRHPRASGFWLAMESTGIEELLKRR